MRRGWLSWLSLAVLILSPGISTTEEQHQAKGSVHTVVVENMQYNPAQLRVRRGDRIVWMNRDLFPHTATAASHAFDSGSIAADASWTYVASRAGEYAYGCTFHPTMKGTIEVQ
jgi:plastocyanin